MSENNWGQTFRGELNEKLNNCILDRQIANNVRDEIIGFVECFRHSNAVIVMDRVYYDSSTLEPPVVGVHAMFRIAWPSSVQFVCFNGLFASHNVEGEKMSAPAMFRNFLFIPMIKSTRAVEIPSPLAVERQSAEPITDLKKSDISGSDTKPCPQCGTPVENGQKCPHCAKSKSFN
ncbi:MAG: hypothetical protein ABR875_03405 [Minisyncoccia bacterium]|jgi:hypothetical protein